MGIKSSAALPLAPDWRDQARHSLRSYEDLESRIELTDSERRGLQLAEKLNLPVAITPYYFSLIDRDNPACPIRRQVIPTADEAQRVPGDLEDPLGEVEHEVAPHLVQRYPDRVLLLVTDRCAVYCRFCTRSRMVGDGDGAQSLRTLSKAFDYIKTNDSIREVIVSGGDPMVMSEKKLVPILERLRAIERLDTVRLATRAPVTIPQRIDESLCRALRAAHPSLWIMTHFNHPKELTPESTQALSMLIDHGLVVMNQSVLLRGVNDSAETLEALFRGLVRRRVRPYYLLQADPVGGTAHLRTRLKTGLEIMARLQGRVSGIALPKFICDTPRGKGKVPLQLNPIVTTKSGVTTLQTFRGEEVDYIDP